MKNSVLLATCHDGLLSKDIGIKKNEEVDRPTKTISLSSCLVRAATLGRSPTYAFVSQYPFQDLFIIVRVNPANGKNKSP